MTVAVVGATDPVVDGVVGRADVVSATGGVLADVVGAAMLVSATLVSAAVFVSAVAEGPGSAIAVGAPAIANAPTTINARRTRLVSFMRYRTGSGEASVDASAAA